MSPVYASYGSVLPVIWNTPFGRIRALATRRSGPVVPVAPVAPVRSRSRSDSLREGSLTASCASEIVSPKGGWTPVGSAFSSARLIGWLGAPPRSGAGRNGAYAVLAPAPTVMKKLAGSGVFTANCADSAKLAPGCPRLSIMPRDRRFDTVWPWRGSYVAYV